MEDTADWVGFYFDAEIQYPEGDDYDRFASELFGSMHKEELPGCCGVAVLHGLSVAHDENVTDHSDTVKALTDTLDDVFHGSYGYGYVIATTATRKSAALCSELGATQLARFRNPKTGNTVSIWGLSRADYNRAKR